MRIWYIFYCLLFCSVLTTHAQTFAIKNNLLSTADAALNIGAEYAIGLKKTIGFSASVRPWKRTETCVNKYWFVEPEFRYWMCQKFNGSFWGAYLNGAQFNVGGKTLPFGFFPSLKRHRYAGWLTGGGISYGYSVMLNRNWNVEASVGVGYEYIRYTKYKCPAVCADILEKYHYHYFGLTKASLSVVYIF